MKCLLCDFPEIEYLCKMTPNSQARRRKYAGGRRCVAYQLCARCFGYAQLRPDKPTMARIEAALAERAASQRQPQPIAAAH